MLFLRLAVLKLSAPHPPRASYAHNRCSRFACRHSGCQSPRAREGAAARGHFPWGDRGRRDLMSSPNDRFGCPGPAPLRPAPSAGGKGRGTRFATPVRAPVAGAPPLCRLPGGSGLLCAPPPPRGDAGESSTQVPGHSAAVGKEEGRRREGHTADTVKRHILRQKWGL